MEHSHKHIALWETPQQHPIHSRAEEAERLSPRATFAPPFSRELTQLVWISSHKTGWCPWLSFRGFSFLQGHFLTRKISLFHNCSIGSIQPIKWRALQQPDASRTFSHVSSPAVPGLSPPRCALRLLSWLFPIKHNCVCKPWVALAMGSHCSLFMKLPSSDPSTPRKLPWRTALESNEDLEQEEGRVQRRQRTNWRKQNPWIRERVQFFGKNPVKGLENLIPNLIHHTDRPAKYILLDSHSR